MVPWVVEQAVRISHETSDSLGKSVSPDTCHGTMVRRLWAPWLLTTHHLLSVPYHHPADPYSSTWRAAVTHTLLMISLSINSLLLRNPRATLGANLISSVYTSLLLIPFLAVAPTVYANARLYIYASAQEEIFLAGVHIKRHSARWWWTFWENSALIAVLVVTWLLCLMVCLLSAQHYIANPAPASQPLLPIQWVASCVFSLLMDVFVFGPLVQLLRMAWQWYHAPTVGPQADSISTALVAPSYVLLQPLQKFCVFISHKISTFRPW